MTKNISIHISNACVKPELYYILLDGNPYGSRFLNLSDVYKEIKFLADREVSDDRITVVRHDVIEHVFNIKFGKKNDHE